MHFFEICPLDVIRDVIFPFLNYDERNAINACMPRHDYIRTPLKKEEVLSFHTKLQTAFMTSLVNKVYATKTDLGRRRAILALFRGIVKYHLPLIYNTQWRSVILDKSNHYASIDNPVFKDANIPMSFKKSISKLANTLVSIMDANPFKYKITISNSVEPTWTAIKPYYYLEHPVKKSNSKC